MAFYRILIANQYTNEWEMIGAVGGGSSERIKHFFVDVLTSLNRPDARMRVNVANARYHHHLRSHKSIKRNIKRQIT
jgi:hypothetical protein